ncbi:ribonuclease domain-containing protein [Catellatospora sp. NPDC049609]|uniref:ribonuclease domain-containing protein n=1 Tax=Catellatospora sp. NPDC049609 TaxID=3155505 RepID=UPI00342358ED
MDRLGTRRNITIAAVAAVLLVALMTLVGYCARTSMEQGVDGGAPAASAARTPASGLPTVAVAELPKEAVATLALIDAGGPFPYAKDGTVFGNLEGILPKQPRGYYKEYTVPTPGSADRGARRLVAGQGGDVYYTADHYESFRQVLR